MRTVTETLCSACGTVLRMESYGENRVKGICVNAACHYNGRAVVAFNLPPVLPAKKKAYTHKRAELDTPPSEKPSGGVEEN